VRKLLLTLVVVATLPLVLWAVLPLPSKAGEDSERLEEIKREISKTKGKLEFKRNKEQVLTSEVAGYSARVRQLQEEVDGLNAQLETLEADLAVKRSELEKIQSDLRTERARLARLRARLAHARRTLAARLVELYKSDEPDAMTVILNADGFGDLLARGEFLSRIGAQDRRIIINVRQARSEAKATTEKLAKLEERQRAITNAVLAKRDGVAAVKEQVVARRERWAAVRRRRAAILDKVAAARQELEGDLAGLKDEQSEIEAKLAEAASPGAGPIRRGAGGLIFPVAGPITSGFGPRWGRLHAGIDIGASSGTPIRAAAGGKVILASPTAGYGNYVCIQHGGSLSTCYAHLSSYATSAGATVSAGEVIGNVGCTGHCFGDHLHFETRVNGSPVDPMGYL
jgi:murein DD-endopeptidase MepM/ murein hydrolase activator NlpD